MVQPVVVAFDSTVGHPPVTAGEPGNRPFDHGSMLAVGVGNSVVREVLSVFALELVVFAELILRPRTAVVHRARSGQSWQAAP